MRRISLFVIFCFSVVISYAQDSASVANDITVLYRKELSGGITIHGSGVGVIFRKGTHRTAKVKRMFEAEFVSMRHPKQKKVTNEYTTGDPKGFFFGKMNYVFITRIGFGQQHVIFGKAEQSGVEVRYNYFGGLALGLAKPVFNDVLVDDPFSADPFQKVVVTKQYDPDDKGQQNVTDFYGPANFFLGFSKIKAYPGVYGKFSVSFEHSTMHQKLSILETGVVADVFLKKIPLMAFIDNSQYYVNFYISLMWGAKKN